MGILELHRKIKERKHSISRYKSASFREKSRVKLVISCGKGKKLYGARSKKKKSAPTSYKCLGFGSYPQYLASDHWLSLRTHYRRLFGISCLICTRKGLTIPGQLHHWTYARIGQEFAGDLIPLCQDHHTELHSLHNSAKKATRKFYRKYGFTQKEVNELTSRRFPASVPVPKLFPA